jgi:hypothetical protein
MERCEDPGEVGVRSTEHISRVIAGATAIGASAADRAAELANRGAIATIEMILESRFAEEAVDRLLASPGLARLGDRIIDSQATERAVARAIDSQVAERAVAQAIDGPLLDEAVTRLLESEDLWLLVDEIARSPAVMDAIGQQSLGFADQVAGAVRARSLNADDRLEMKIRSLVRRRHRGGVPTPEQDGNP